MGIRSAKSERTHSGILRAASVGPRDEVVGDLNRPLPPVDLWTGLGEMKMRRNAVPWLHHEHDFDQTGQACCCLGVAKIGFYRSDEEWRFMASAYPINSPNRPNLYGIAQWSSRAMGFHIADRVRLQSRVGKCLPHHRFLRRAVGSCDSGAAS